MNSHWKKHRIGSVGEARVRLLCQWQWQHLPHSTREAKLLRAIGGTATPAPFNKYSGTVCTMNAPLVWSLCKTSQRWADQRPPSVHTTSHVVQANWRLAEDTGNHDHGRPETTLQSAILRLRLIEKGLGGCFYWALTGTLSLGWLGQLDWWCPLNTPRVNATTSKSTK